jgi:hypothetical protein
LSLLTYYNFEEQDSLADLRTLSFACSSVSEEVREAAACIQTKLLSHCLLEML